MKKVVKKKTPVRRKPPAASARRRGDALSGPIHGIAPYKPARGEEYMSDAQLEHFRNILTAWKNELMFEVDRTVHHMQDEAANFPDPNDRATQESEFGLELRTRDRERKLLRKIDSALLASTTASTASATKPAKRSALNAWKLARSQRYALKHRNAASWPSASIATEMTGIDSSIR